MTLAVSQRNTQHYTSSAWSGFKGLRRKINCHSSEQLIKKQDTTEKEKLENKMNLEKKKRWATKS